MLRCEPCPASDILLDEEHERPTSQAVEVGIPHFFSCPRKTRSEPGAGRRRRGKAASQNLLGGVKSTMKSEFLAAITQLSSEKGVPKEMVLEALRAALVSAYK